MRSLFLQRRFTKHASLTHLYLCNAAFKHEPESLGWPPTPLLHPRLGTRRDEPPVSLPASLGTRWLKKHDRSRLCCQPGADLENHNVPDLLPDPVATPILPHTHAAEDARRN